MYAFSEMNKSRGQRPQELPLGSNEVLLLAYEHVFGMSTVVGYANLF